MDDLISRHGVAAWLDNMGYPNLAKTVMDKNRFPNERFGEKGQSMTELINKQKVLDLVRDICIEIMDECESYIDIIDGEADRIYKNLSEVNAILKCNKRIRNGIRRLPSEPVGKSKQLDRTCAKCKFYTADGICVQWSRYRFQSEDYCSRWEGER